MVLLVTSDNEQFVVEKDVAERSVLIKNMLEGKSHPSIPRPMPLTRDFFRRRRE
jgi:S-phase kinase-associated protein 1